VQEFDRDTRPKRFHSPVTIHEGTLSEIRGQIPAFERRGFALTQPGNERSRLNERLDSIVRLPFGEHETFIPVGVVSKDYALVPHTAVLEVATKALDAAKIPLAGVKGKLEITEYGERMALSLTLPDRYAFDPGDGHPMALRLECVNSVDGQHPLPRVHGLVSLRVQQRPRHRRHPIRRAAPACRRSPACGCRRGPHIRPDRRGD
jgi:hypothetical protein